MARRRVLRCLDHLRLRGVAVCWFELLGGDRRFEEQPLAVEAGTDCRDEHAQTLVDCWFAWRAVSDDEELLEAGVAVVPGDRLPLFDDVERSVSGRSYPPADYRQRV